MSSISKFWDRVAKRFAAAEIKDVESYERRVTAIEAALSAEARLLDMACGSGALAVRLAPKVGHIDAIDISEKMIAIARVRAEEAGVENIRFQRAAIEDFQGERASYDAVLAMSILHLLDDWRGAITKAHALLKPGGILAANTHCLAGEKKRLKFFVRIGVPLGIMPNIQVIPEQDLLEALREAGFVIEDHWQKSGKKPVFVLVRKPG